MIQSIRDDKRFTKFADLALINVGITTGNNTYFSVDKTTNERYDLTSVTFPLIGRSSHAHGIYFTDKDWQENIKADKRAMLISFLTHLMKHILLNIRNTLNLARGTKKTKDISVLSVTGGISSRRYGYLMLSFSEEITSTLSLC